jgi:hypothetical protein
MLAQLEQNVALAPGGARLVVRSRSLMKNRYRPNVV